MKFQGVQAFYLMLFGQLLSVVGSGMTRFGLSVWVFEQTGSASDFSRLIFFAMIPMAVGSLFAGPLVDRLPRRQVMIWSNIIASVSTLFVVVLFYNDNLLQWHLYLALFVNGLANSFLVPAFEASVPLLVPKNQLARASGMGQMVSALDSIISPILAGIVVTTLGLGAVFIVDIVTFLCGVTALLLCIIPNPANKAEGEFHFWRDLRLGWEYLWERKPFIYLIILVSLLMFIQGAVYALTGPLVLTFSDANALAWCYAGFGVGALIGGLVVSIWGGTQRRMNGIVLGLLVCTTGVFLTALDANIWLIVVGFFFFGAGFIFLFSLYRVIYQVKAAPEVLGRIFALRMVIGMSMQGVGILLSGWLATRFFEPLLREGGALATSLGTWLGVGAGRGVALLYLILACGLLALSLWAAHPRMRLLEDELPDYIADKVAI